MGDYQSSNLINYNYPIFNRENILYDSMYFVGNIIILEEASAAQSENT